MSGELKTYTVEINGVAATLRLSQDDAKARGLLAEKPAPEKMAAPAKKAAKPAANKARTAANK